MSQVTTTSDELSDGIATLGGGFAFSTIPGFPYLEYSNLQERYTNQAHWFSGRALDETFKVENKDVEKYPIRINPFPATCMKHAYALFGEVSDDSRPLVLPKFVVPMGKRKELKETIEAAEDTMNYLWWENFGRTLQMKNGILSQMFGGCVFGLKWVPWESYRTLHIKIESIDPRFFIGFPIPGDEYRLKEAWIVKPIDWSAAEYYGVKVEPNTPTYWIEHWTPQKYSFTINGKPITNVPEAGEDWKSSGDNEFGFVPYVYIPHNRITGFYGTNVYDALTGIVKEYNLRMADYGDAVSQDAHNHVVMSNTQGSPQIRRIDDGLKAIDLGNSAAITGSEHEPKMYELRKPSASVPMKDLTVSLLKEYRRGAFLPAVADGEDEGSQRSGETLMIRMWPLISHTSSERYFWTGGLDWLTRMALIILRAKGEGAITDEHLAMRTKHDWAPPLPKDREAVVNEAVNRMSTNLGSPQKLMDMLGEEDPDETTEELLEWLTALAEVTADATAAAYAKYNPQQQGGEGGGQKGVASKGNANPSGANSAS